MSYSKFKAEVSKRPLIEERSFKLSQSPHPEWKLGQGANNNEWKQHKKLQFDPTTNEMVQNYKTLIGGVVPRPVAFVSTRDVNGVDNLAPVSFFTIANNDPPVLVVSMSKNTGVAKDTANNILETKEATVSIISEWFIEAANMGAIDAPSNEDEWKFTGLTKEESTDVKPPLVAESAYSMECKYVTHHEWTSKKTGKPVSDTFLLEVVKFHIREDVWDAEKGYVKIEKLQPVSRLGGITYGRTTEGYELVRPSYADREQY